MNDANQREEAIFELILQAAPERRAMLVAQICGDDIELQRRVESLLSANDEAGAFLEKVVPEGKTIHLDLPVEEKPGTIIGRYKILEKVGEGGFGAVYVAEQREPVKRRVALKIIKLGMDTRQVVARFEAERQALAMMDHPNIAKVLDAGATETGRPFFVMELVRGIKFTDYCDQNKLSTEERLELFIKVCQAIQHAHQKGIIHRDIKPSNILVTLHDGVPIPKVIDFGIAKATQGELTEKTVYTNFQQFIGTPAYMSPEQAEMSGLDVDTRSDIYSLGVLLYELLTGRTPFDQKQLMEAGLDAMRRMIREEEPMRPSTRINSLKGEERTTTAQRRHTEAPKLIHMLRGDLDWIVMKCLEKDRTRRYESANGLAMDIRRYITNEPVVARPPSKLYRFQKTVRRNKLAFAAGVVVVAALILGAAVSTWEAMRATRERRQAETINRFLQVDLLTQSTPDADASAEAREGMAEVLKRASVRLDQDREIASQPELEATLRLAIGSTYFKLGFLDEAQRDIRRSVDLRRTIHGLMNKETLMAQEELAYLLVAWLRQHDDGEKLSFETWQARRKIYGPHDALTLESMDTYAMALQYQKKMTESEQLYRTCLADSERYLGANSTNTIRTLGNLAALLQDRGNPGDWDEAERKYNEVLKRQANLHVPKNADYFATYNNLGMILFLQGRVAEAIPVLENAVTNAQAACGPENLATLHLQHVLARMLTVAGRNGEAEVLAKKTLEVRRRKMPQHESTGRTMLILARVLVESNRAGEAEPLLREAQSLFREHSPKRTELAAQAANWLGTIQLGRQAYPEAASLLLPSAEPILAPSAGMSAAEQQTCIGHIIQLYQAWGKPEEAVVWQKKVDELARK